MNNIRKYININKNTKEYGNVYEEISFPSRAIIKVKNPIKNVVDYFEKYDLKEISALSFDNIVSAYQDGNPQLSLYFKNYTLSRIGNFIYGERLETNQKPNEKSYYNLCDEDFESIVSFENIDELKNVFKNNQYVSDYFNDDRIVISAYYLASTGKLVLAENLMEDIHRKLLEKEPIYNINNLTKFVVIDKTMIESMYIEIRAKRKMFLSIAWDKQLNIVANEIRTYLNT